MTKEKLEQLSVYTGPIGKHDTWYAFLYKGEKVWVKMMNRKDQKDDILKKEFIEEVLQHLEKGSHKYDQLVSDIARIDAIQGGNNA